MAKLLTLIVLLSVPLSAHDFWIEPTSFVAEPGKVVGLRLRVGENLAGDPVPRDGSAMERFVVAGQDAPRDVAGRDGMDPAGVIRIESSGLHVVGYRSRPGPVSLTAEKFNQYLREEGLDAVLGERERRKQTNAPTREIFSRAAKALVLAGAPNPKERDRALGFRLELIADENPYARGAGRELPFRLLYEGRPLTGALVVAFNRYRPLAKLSARTDLQGRVAFPIADRGMWLVKAVHMVPAPTGSDAEWESIWASLTFDLPPLVAASPLARPFSKPSVR